MSLSDLPNVSIPTLTKHASLDDVQQLPKDPPSIVAKTKSEGDLSSLALETQNLEQQKSKVVLDANNAHVSHDADHLAAQLQSQLDGADEFKVGNGVVDFGNNLVFNIDDYQANMPLMKFSAAQKLDDLAFDYVEEKRENGATKKLEQLANNIKDLLGLKDTSTVEAMIQERNAVKQFKPDFLPGKVPKMSSLPDPSNASTQAKFNWQNIARLALAKEQEHIKVVDEQSRLVDQGLGVSKKKTLMLEPVKRDEQRVITTAQGLKQYDQQSNTLTSFTTQGMESHGKKDYSAFVINADGQLYNFNHKDKTDQIAHSSYTHGGPAFGAGEMKVNEQGQLEVLTAYSGHYKPTPKDMARVLLFLQEQGMDVSKAVVAFQHTNGDQFNDLTPVDPDEIGFTAPTATEHDDIVREEWGDNAGLVRYHLGTLFSAQELMDTFADEVFDVKPTPDKFKQDIQDDFELNMGSSNVEIDGLFDDIGDLGQQSKGNDEDDLEARLKALKDL